MGTDRTKPMRAIRVDLGGGAASFIPTPETDKDRGLDDALRYGPKPPDPGDVGMAMTCLDSFQYLFLHCTKEEAWRRIKLMREAHYRHIEEGKLPF